MAIGYHIRALSLDLAKIKIDTVFCLRLQGRFQLGSSNLGSANSGITVGNRRQ